MKSLLSNAVDLLVRTYRLALPYGRKKLAIVGTAIFCQSILQVVGVTSIFPFLTLAANPDAFRNSHYGREFLARFPLIEDSKLLLIAGIFAVGMILLANLTNILGEYIRSRYANRFAHWLRLRLINQIAARPYADFLQANTGVLVKKVQADVSTFANSVLLNLLDISTRLITVVLLIITLFLVQPVIALCATLGLATIYGIFYKSLQPWRVNASATMKHCERGSFKEIQQLFGGIKAVKIHRAESQFIGQYSAYSDKQSKIKAWIP